MMGPNSESLHSMLVRQGIETGRGGTRKATEGAQPVGAGAAHEKKEAGRSRNGAARQVAHGQSREEGRSHADNPSPERHRPVLRVVNGKCLPRVQTPCRSPSIALGRHLTLVWSQ